VHDLIHHKYYSGIRQWLHNKQKDVALKRSSAIICVSKNTRNDLLTYFPYLNPDIIKIVHNGVSDDFFLLANDHPYEISEEILNSNYLLSISSREHYKNFWFTVQLAAKLPDFKLYIVGPKLNSKEVQLLNENLPNRWKLFSSINNLKLNELYNHAYALIYPSSYEGFGIPLLEAMKAKCPFIALNTSSIPEVAGDAGILIDELDIEEFVKAVECLGNYRADLIIKGDLQVGNFSWDKCYLETKEVYINSLR
jgi:mannosyltransferase